MRRCLVDVVNTFRIARNVCGDYILRFVVCGFKVCGLLDQSFYTNSIIRYGALKTLHYSKTGNRCRWLAKSFQAAPIISVFTGVHFTYGSVTASSKSKSSVSQRPQIQCFTT